MKNQSLRIIHKTEKKSVHLTGNLTLPLRAGERAWINCLGRQLMTSVVIRITEVSPTGVVFETQNTIYSLNYSVMPAKAGVMMCA